MCGVVGTISHRPVNQLLYDALLLLQHRGQDAAGIATVTLDAPGAPVIGPGYTFASVTEKIAKITLTRPAFLAMLVQGRKLPELVQAGLVKVEGNPQAFAALGANIVNFEPVFNIVTP